MSTGLTLQYLQGWGFWTAPARVVTPRLGSAPLQEVFWTSCFSRWRSWRWMRMWPSARPWIKTWRALWPRLSSCSLKAFLKKTCLQRSPGSPTQVSRFHAALPARRRFAVGRSSRPDTPVPRWQQRFWSQHLCEGLCRNPAICLLAPRVSSFSHLYIG